MTGAPFAAGPRWWLLLPAGLACAACCALPVLAAAGIVGGAAAALGHWLPAAAIALAVVSVLLFAVPAWRRRAPARTAGCACETGGECRSHRPEQSTSVFAPRVRS